MESQQPEGKNSIIVAGDVTIDWNLARTRGAARRTAVWSAQDSVCLYPRWGGAALFGELLQEVAEDLERGGTAQYEVIQATAREERCRPEEQDCHHSYAVWSLFDYSANRSREAKAWRVEEFLGLSHRSSIEPPDWQRLATDPDAADVVLLDDANLGFRDCADLWPQALQTGQCRWALTTMASPVAEGPLWELLHEKLAERLIVLMRVNDLRLTEVQISRELSWERTAQDLAWELVHNPAVNALSQCAHLVVSFDTAGALLLSRRAEQGNGVPRARLFFDPQVMEGGWAARHPGGMVGYTSCLAAGIARQLMIDSEIPDIDSGIQSGLAAMRRLHREGYGERGSSATEAALAFPAASIVDELGREASYLSAADVPTLVNGTAGWQADAATSKPPEPWTILGDRYKGMLHGVAERIVLKGPDVALEGVPLAYFGNLITADRNEIEAFRSVRALMAEYCDSASSQPLSIAVFGPPGSGKSFGVTQVAKSIMPGKVQKLTFNLSQFGDPSDLLDAFHQARDVGLSGKLPVVFWDEFDCALDGRPLGWLSQFLAPMQDGEFQDGQITHPIGHSIFVFAGGTSETMEGFASGKGSADFRALKGPDFVSRVKGFVNIMGPNPLEGRANADPHFIIRRAILLRSILSRKTPLLFDGHDGSGLLNIDSGVLRAFLEIGKYAHGARSIESIATTSLLAGRQRFERSCLPSEHQLNLHVNGVEFLALVQQVRLEGELLERLAEKTHEFFCRRLEAEGYGPGEATDDEQKVHSSLKPFAELPDDEKEQNRDNARDIPKKLAAIGCVMLPARSSQRSFCLSDDELDLLAELEHDRWLRMKLEAGWQWAEATDKARRLHQDLRPWTKLSDEEAAERFGGPGARNVGPGELDESSKAKDRHLVEEIPEILSEIGYTIEELGGPPRE